MYLPLLHILLSCFVVVRLPVNVLKSSPENREYASFVIVFQYVLALLAFRELSKFMPCIILISLSYCMMLDNDMMDLFCPPGYAIATS